MDKKPVLWIIVPCYNEQEVLPMTAPILAEKIRELQEMGKVDSRSRILFVDDGSDDRTWDIINGLAKEDSVFLGIRQSRNRGHQNALVAGFMEAKDSCDITISIDCDGQDDINAMNEMVEEYLNGCEIVYGVRSDRKKDTWSKRSSAQGFYRLMNKLGAEVVYNHADYRLVSTRVLQAFSDFQEVNIFLRGMFPLVGFKSTCVYYERKERIAGKSHYPVRKMLGLALDGVTSLSIRPIRIIALIGFLISILGFAGIIWAVAEAILGKTVAGWASIMCVLFFLGGLQLLSLGVIGEYVGKTYLEAKHRPRYIISERTEEKETERISEKEA